MSRSYISSPPSATWRVAGLLCFCLNRGNQFHEIGSIKLETMNSSKNFAVLNWGYTQSHMIQHAQKSFHVTLCMTCILKQWHFTVEP
jgi:hypothetical protein